jgi:hypothetical protein
VRGTGCTAHEKEHLPFGVASTLRRAKSKAPALHCRAESPVISSTGQRPVETGISQQPALKGRNPRSFDSAPSRRDGMCITVCKRSTAYGRGVHLHSKSRRDGIIPPLRGLWGEAASTPRVTPSASPAVMHLPPFQGYGRKISFIHRALPCAIDLRAFSPEPFITSCRDAMHCISTKNRKFL